MIDCVLNRIQYKCHLGPEQPDVSGKLVFPTKDRATCSARYLEQDPSTDVATGLPRQRSEVGKDLQRASAAGN